MQRKVRAGLKLANLITVAVLIIELRFPKPGRLSKGMNSAAILHINESIEKINTIIEYVL